MMLKLKLQYYGHLMRRVNSLEKTLMLGGIGGRRRRERQRMRWLNGIMDSMDMSLSELREMVMNREAWRAVIHRVAKSWTRLSDWTELNWWNWMPWSSIFECWVLSQLFHSPFSLSSRGSFSSSSFSAIRVMSSVYLRLLIFLLAILTPDCGIPALCFIQPLTNTFFIAFIKAVLSGPSLRI